MNYLRNRPFLVITLFHFPEANQRTEDKNFSLKARWETKEHVTVEDRVQHKHLGSASVIIDILNKKLVKSRFGETDEQVLNHFLTKYKTEVGEAVGIWDKKGFGTQQ